MEIFLLILIGVLLIGIVTYLISAKMYKQLIFSPKQEGGFLFYREAIEQRFHLKDFNRWKKEIFYIESDFGYYICATHIHAKQPSKRLIILCHGFSCQQLTSYKYVQLFLDRGFHVITYDQRFHGFSGGDFITYGYYEKEDLKKLIQWGHQTFGSDCQIGVHGESMGAVTALLYAANSENVADFYIADCPFSNFSSIIRERYKHNYPYMPYFPFLKISKWMWEKRLAFTWEMLSPVLFMKKNINPVLLLHTKHDHFTVPAHSQRLHEAAPNETTLVIFPEGGHAQGIVKNREKYEEAVDKFLEKILKSK